MTQVEFECGFQENVDNEDAIFNKKLRCPECREMEGFKIGWSYKKE